MKEVIWIFGPGGSGKKTMMLEAANHQIKPGRLRERFGIRYDKPVIPLVMCAKPLRDRERIIRQMLDTEIDAVIMIHGQDVDWEKGILSSLYDDYPDCFDRFGFVLPEKSIYSSRLEKRGKKARNYNNEIMRKQHIVRTLYKWFKSMVEII